MYLCLRCILRNTYCVARFPHRLFCRAYAVELTLHSLFRSADSVLTVLCTRFAVHVPSRICHSADCILPPVRRLQRADFAPHIQQCVIHTADIVEHIPCYFFYTEYSILPILYIPFPCHPLVVDLTATWCLLLHASAQGFFPSFLRLVPFVISMSEPQSWQEHYVWLMNNTLK